MSLNAFLKEGSEFKERDSRFHSLGAETWNVHKPIIVLHRGSATDLYLMIVGTKEGC